MQGSRGETTRCGTKNSGITGHLRGWNLGAMVNVWYDEKSGEDRVEVFITNGSYGGAWPFKKSLGVFGRNEHGTYKLD